MRTWQQSIGPDTWPDADMLPIGKIGIRAERGDNRFTRFTNDEQITLISLWSLFKSPLMFGGNLPDNDDFTLQLITNDEVLAINQHSINNKEVLNKDGIIVWSATSKDEKDIFMGFFNTTDSDTTIELRFDELGLAEQTYTARDLWLHQNLNPVEDAMVFNVNKHGVKLIKFRN